MTTTLRPPIHGNVAGVASSVAIGNATTLTVRRNSSRKGRSLRITRLYTLDNVITSAHTPSAIVRSDTNTFYNDTSQRSILRSVHDLRHHLHMTLLMLRPRKQPQEWTLSRKLPEKHMPVVCRMQVLFAARSPTWKSSVWYRRTYLFRQRLHARPATTSLLVHMTFGVISRLSTVQWSIKPK